MGNITTGLVIVMCINVMLFLGQAAAINMHEESNRFYNDTGSLLSDFDTGEYVTPSNPDELIPSGASSVNPETGNIFTDTFSSSRSWVLETTGLGYIMNLLGAPAQFLYSIGLPAAFSWAIGALWYGMTLFFIVAFILGRET